MEQLTQVEDAIALYLDISEDAMWLVARLEYVYDGEHVSAFAGRGTGRIAEGTGRAQLFFLSWWITWMNSIPHISKTMCTGPLRWKN